MPGVRRTRVGACRGKVAMHAGIVIQRDASQKALSTSRISRGSTTTALPIARILFIRVQGSNRCAALVVELRLTLPAATTSAQDC